MSDRCQRGKASQPREGILRRHMACGGIEGRWQVITAVILTNATASEIAYVAVALRKKQESTAEWAIRMAEEHPDLSKKASQTDQENADPASVRFP